MCSLRNTSSLQYKVWHRHGHPVRYPCPFWPNMRASAVTWLLCSFGFWRIVVTFRQSYNTQLPIQHLPLSHFRINHQLLLPPSWKSAMRKWRERRPGGSLLEPPYIIFACTCTAVRSVVPYVYMLALVRPPRYAVLKGS